MPHTSEDLSEVWQGQIEASIQLGWRWIFLLRQEIFGRHMAIISEWMGKRCWPWDHQWSRTWQKESPGLAQFDKEHFFGTQGPRFSTAWHQSSSAGHSIVWSIVFLFAERIFRLCVNRNFDTIFDPDLPEPNRIFGLLNLSNMSTSTFSKAGNSITLVPVDSLPEERRCQSRPGRACVGRFVRVTTSSPLSRAS